MNFALCKYSGLTPFCLSMILYIKYLRRANVAAICLLVGIPSGTLSAENTNLITASQQTNDQMKTEFILKQKELLNTTGQPQRFSLTMQHMKRLHLGGEPNRIVELNVADVVVKTNLMRVWAAAVHASDAFPPTKWITDIAETQDKSRKLVLVVQTKTYLTDLKIYEVDMTRPALTNQSTDELLKNSPAPIATLKFRYSNSLFELVSAEMVSKGNIIEINGTSQQVGGVRGGPPEPFVIKFNRKTRRWEIPSELTKKINLTVDKNK